MKNRRPRKGFTLVEILIVVVILGILAAIVIPQFTNASNAAKVSSCKTQLNSIRSQLELFHAKNGFYPATLFGNELDGDGLPTGLLAADPANGGRSYLQQPASNPFFTGADAADGWAYDPDLGQIRIPGDTLPSGVDASEFGGYDLFDGAGGIVDLDGVGEVELGGGDVVID